MTHLFFIDKIKRINSLMLLLGLLILPFQATAQFYEDPGSGVRVIRQTFLTTRSTVVTVSAPISLSAFSVRVARDLVGVDDFGLSFFVYDNGLDNGDYSVVTDDPAGKLLYKTDVASFTSNSNSDFQWRKSPDFTMPVNLLPGRKYLLGIMPDKNIYSIHRLSSYTQANVTAQTQVREGSPPGTTYYNNRRLELQLFAPEADISISKSNGLDEVSPASTVTYTVTATNSGPNGARATVSDILPVTLENSAWTCAGVAGGVCAPSGAGNIADAVELPAGASVVYSIVTKVAMNASGTIENTATVTVDAGINDPNLINNTATDTDAVKEKAIIPVASAKPVPSMTILAAGFLAMLIFSAALFLNKRRK